MNEPVRRAAVVMVLAILSAQAAADETETSEKARIANIVALGRMNDPRQLPSILRALSDPSPVVRGLAASALGHLGDARAVPALERAGRDPDEGVRARAAAALSELRDPPPPSPPPPSPMPTKVRMTAKEAPRHGPLRVVVNAMANRVAGSGHLTGRMRDLVVRQLNAEPALSVNTAGDGEYVVDGAITKLSREERGAMVEVTCEVKLTVSNASGSLLSIVSGGATVQGARGRGSRGMETEALDSAVGGLQEKLAGFLARRR
jgi:HEAT repeat protein